MSWFSILPAHLTVIETWIIRFFLLLTILTIGPWALFLAYDLLLYFLRTLLYEIPYVGGRTRGERRPAKPTLEQRPDGEKRRVLSVSFASGSEDGAARGRGSKADDAENEGEEMEMREWIRRRRELDRRSRRAEEVGDEAVGD